MHKIFIQSIYPAPYRTGVFNLLAKTYDTTLFFESKEGDNRNSSFFDKKIMGEYYFLDEKKNKQIYNKKLKNIREYDMVLAYDYSSVRSLLLLVRCIVNKVPYCINCDGAFIQHNFIKDNIKKFFIKRAKACLASGEYAKKYFIEFGAREEQIYIHNFTSLYEKDILKEIISKETKKRIRQELGLPDKRIYIGVGSFIKRKGFDILLEAIAKTKSNDEFFIIIGGGPDEVEYINIIKKYKIGNVKLINFLDKETLLKYYDAADIFVLPTREDIWGLVINEAMARGLPIISTNRCIAAMELVKDQDNGFIANVESVSDIASAIEYYRTLNEDDLNQQKFNSLKKIRTYTIENIAKSHIEVINNLL